MNKIIYLFIFSSLITGLSCFSIDWGKQRNVTHCIHTTETVKIGVRISMVLTVVFVLIFRNIIDKTEDEKKFITLRNICIYIYFGMLLVLVTADGIQYTCKNAAISVFEILDMINTVSHTIYIFLLNILISKISFIEKYINSLGSSKKLMIQKMTTVLVYCTTYTAVYLWAAQTIIDLCSK